MTGFKVTVDLPLHEEDAPSYADERCIIVCDGLGSGSTPIAYKGESHTSSYYASRVVSSTTASFVESRYVDFFDPSKRDELLDDLKRTISDSITGFASEVGVNTTSIGGSMFKLLPTTLAMIVFREKEESIDAISIWVGDSRCFVMDPLNGLRQLSDDDIDSEKDPMDALLEDSPMNNTISLGRDFHLNILEQSFRKPCMLLVASDGCFAYWDSPMDFERIILPTHGIEGFTLVSEIRDSLSHRKYDDRSLAAVCFDISDDADYACLFDERRKFMEKKYYSRMIYTDEIEELKARLREARSMPRGPERTDSMNAIRELLNPLEKKNKKLMLEMWQEYRETYDCIRLAYHNREDDATSGDADGGMDEGTDYGGAAGPDLSGPSSVVVTDLLDELAVTVRNMGSICGYTLDASTVRIMDYYVEAMAVKRRSDQTYRFIFKPRTEGDVSRKKLMDLNSGFKKVCGECGVIQMPVVIELTDDCLIMGFVDGDINGFRRYIPADVHKMKRSLFIEASIQLMSALESMHSNNIVHGGVDQNNIEIWTGYGGGVVCRLNNYSRSFYTNGVGCDFDTEAGRLGASYDSSCLAFLLFRLRSPSAFVRYSNPESLKGAMELSNDPLDKILAELAVPGKITLREAMESFRGCLNR